MSWFSILPKSISFIETWLIRLFLVLGAIAIGPWVLLLLYDAVLYIFRTATYEVPYVGGRARNRPRPRAPSLSERPSGKKRSLSLPIPPALAAEAEAAAEATGGLKKRLAGQGHGRNGSNISIDE